mmetsp:Transcript_53915/g.109951  ORF Transcript_53915/g.109951 Transcript_53915/m.109951 type:complete len:95 (-) Transcript_53915:307-591(-)
MPSGEGRTLSNAQQAKWCDCFSLRTMLHQTIPAVQDQEPYPCLATVRHDPSQVQRLQYTPRMPVGLIPEPASDSDVLGPPPSLGRDFHRLKPHV